MSQAISNNWHSYEQQCHLLHVRGMNIGDSKATLDYLQRIGYYRLSAYWYPFRQYRLEQDRLSGKVSYVKLDDFEQNTHFKDAVELYLFDKKLKLMLVDALERIEVAMRVDVAHLLGERDPYAYLNPQLLHPSFVNKKNAYENWKAKYHKQLADSKEDFVKHYQQKPDSRLPIWAASQIWDFGSLSKLFSMLKVSDQQFITERYGLNANDWEVFQNWLHVLNYIRNICAHHSRLWNRNMDVQPSMPKHGSPSWCQEFVGKTDLLARCFVGISILRHVVLVVCPNTNWHHRLADHLNKFPEVASNKKVGLGDMWIAENWQSWW